MTAIQPSTTSDDLLARRAAAVPRGVATTHPIFLDRGEGAVVWDTAGRRYLDFAGGLGVLNVGHAAPAVVEAIARQAQRLTHTCFQVAMYEPYVAVAEALNARAPGAFAKKTLLLSTGAEALENAVKIARQFTRRPAVLTFTHGYHGRTLLALTMTGKNVPYKQHFGPYASEVYHAPFPIERRGMPVRAALAELDDIFESVVAPDRIAAIVIEPILGEGGFVPAPAAFVAALRARCDRYGIVLVADEVQSGFGRTGTFFACEQLGLEPDLLTSAKSIAGGLPLSAVTGRTEIMDAVEPGGLGGTFAGNPIACAAALAVFETMDESFLARARAIGERLTSALRALQARFAAIEDVRGLGPMTAMELRHGAREIVAAARERGLLLLLAGKGDVIRLLVPLIADDATIDEGLRVLGDSVARILEP